MENVFIFLLWFCNLGWGYRSDRQNNVLSLRKSQRFRQNQVFFIEHKVLYRANSTCLIAIPLIHEILFLAFPFAFLQFVFNRVIHSWPSRRLRYRRFLLTRHSTTIFVHGFHINLKLLLTLYYYLLLYIVYSNDYTLKLLLHEILNIFRQDHVSEATIKSLMTITF